MATFDSIAAQLRSLVKSAKRDAMQRVVLAGERLVKLEAPVKQGTLRRSIVGRVEAGGDRGVVGTNVRYARAVHDGTRAHTIRPTTKKALSWPGARHPVRVVNHPGSKANPFIKRGGDRLRPVAERELQAWGNTQVGKVR